MQKNLLLLILCLFIIPCLPALDFSLDAALGATSPAYLNDPLWDPGIGLNLFGNSRLASFFDLDYGINYSHLPIHDSTTIFVSLFSLEAGGDIHLNTRFAAGIEGTVGYFLGLIIDGSAPPAFNPLYSLGINSSFKITPGLEVGLKLLYRQYYGFYDNITLALNTIFHFNPLPFKQKTRPETIQPELLEGSIQISEVRFAIFPVLFKYYDQNPVGKAKISNTLLVPVRDVKVSLYARQFMDDPKKCIEIPRLEPGAEQEIDLYALFTDKVLEITEGTKVSCKITVDYTFNNEPASAEFIETMALQNRNAVTWDDDQKAACFVTSKDPGILKFSKNVASIIKEDLSAAIDKNLAIAIALYETLDLYGMAYIPDPKTPYKTLSQAKEEIDYLQFPIQTLEYKAGDCDDLSILYSALMESAGVDTAFITIPGHIFMAFSPNLTPAEVKKQFKNTGAFIFRGEKTWIPVESTALGQGFLAAWQKGAKQWREYTADNRARLLAMQDSWQVYEPVGFNLSGEADILPERDQIVKHSRAELQKFITWEIQEEVLKLNDAILAKADNAKYINKLGVLYARYGAYDDAARQFEKVLSEQEYLPARLNLGNVYLIRGRQEDARRLYEQVLRERPQNKPALVGLARIHHQQENYGRVKEIYAQLQELDPAAARQFAYLDLQGEQALRAADQTRAKEIYLWEEE